MGPSIISIGYGRQVFDSANPERRRLAACATAVGRFDMIIFSRKAHGLTTQIVSPQLTLHPTNSRYPLLYLVDAFLLARRLVKQSPVPVTITTQDPFETAMVGLLLKKLYRTRLIVQEHGDFFGLLHWRKENFTNRLRYRFGLFVLKQADLVRVVSARTKKHFIEKGIKNIVTLPVVVDSTPFLEAQPDEQVREMFGDGTFVFLSVARFVPQKNFPLLLKAFALAYEQNNNIRLLIVGTGQEEENMRNIISQFKSETQSAISILPWSNNVAGLMKSASAYILSSNYEGWGRVLVEAVLAKLPIVTTAVGAADEVVKHEVQGLVVPVDDVEALSKAMVYLSTDESLYRRLKENLTKITGIPGTDKEQYQTQWAQVFLSE